jgi:hypothetical protein
MRSCAVWRHETITLLLRAGKPTTRVKIARLFETVTQEEIAEALAVQVASKANTLDGPSWHCSCQD